MILWLNQGVRSLGEKLSSQPSPPSVISSDIVDSLGLEILMFQHLEKQSQGGRFIFKAFSFCQVIARKPFQDGIDKAFQLHGFPSLWGD
jgi:hypothetical protein